MSDDNNNSSNFDFDFDALSAENPPENSENSAFDLDNPFGDDMVMSSSEVAVSADNPFINDSFPDESTDDDSAKESDSDEGESSSEETTEKKKKGFFGRSTGKTAKPKKEKTKKEKVVKTKEKKETAPRGTIPRDWGTILCIVFSLFLLISLVTLNVTAFLSRESGSSIVHTLCFMAAFDIIGLAAAAVPILFYKFPKERTLPNVMLGIAAVAMLVGVQILVTEFYSYQFILKP